MNSVYRTTAWTPFVLVAAIGCLSCLLTGCSLFVMAGKMIWGDPKIPSAFRQKTGINLTKADKRLLIVCSTPEAVKSEMPSLDLDLIDEITRRLGRNRIQVVNPDKVAKWVDDHGGTFGESSELIKQFEPDYIAHIDVEQFSIRETNSPTMLRGRAGGSIVVYEVTEESKRGGELSSIFAGDFFSEYPHLHPVSVDQVSPKNFQMDFVKHLSTQLSRFFYDYHFREEF